MMFAPDYISPESERTPLELVAKLHNEAVFAVAVTAGKTRQFFQVPPCVSP